jgi:hypothetical protein
MKTVVFQGGSALFGSEACFGCDLDGVNIRSPRTWRNEGGFAPDRVGIRLAAAIVESRPSDPSGAGGGNRLLPPLPFDMARDLYDRIIDPTRSVSIMLHYGPL